MNNTDKCPLITNENDFEEILKAKDKVIALIYATWCPFCMRFLPVFKRYASHSRQEKINFMLAQDNEEIFADKYGVDVVPTVIFFEKGKVSKRLDGVLGIGLNEKQLTDFVNTLLLT